MELRLLAGKDMSNVVFVRDKDFFEVWGSVSHISPDQLRGWTSQADHCGQLSHGYMYPGLL